MTKQSSSKKPKPAVISRVVSPEEDARMTRQTWELVRHTLNELAEWRRRSMRSGIVLDCAVQPADAETRGSYARSLCRYTSSLPAPFAYLESIAQRASILNVFYSQSEHEWQAPKYAERLHRHLQAKGFFR